MSDRAGKDSSRALGQHKESLAEAWLQARGLRTLCRNFHSRAGEIDLIMRDGDCLVFVEVRFRGRQQFGTAVESVNAWKQARLLRCARYFLLRHFQNAEPPCRFDILAMSPGTAPQTHHYQWIRNAFSA